MEKVYQGPVRPTDDEAHFRKTGKTRPLNEHKASTSSHLKVNYPNLLPKRLSNKKILKSTKRPTLVIKNPKDVAYRSTYFKEAGIDMNNNFLFGD